MTNTAVHDKDGVYRLRCSIREVVFDAGAALTSQGEEHGVEGPRRYT